MFKSSIFIFNADPAPESNLFVVHVVTWLACEQMMTPSCFRRYGQIGDRSGLEKLAASNMKMLDLNTLR